MAYAGIHIQNSIMTRRRAAALERLILETARHHTVGRVLYINQLYMALERVDKQLIRTALRRHGYTKVSQFTWERTDGKKQVGAPTNPEGRQKEGRPKGAVCTSEGTEVFY